MRAIVYAIIRATLAAAPASSELDTALALIGATNPSAVTRDRIRHGSQQVPRGERC
jgi:hypothetical protein